MRRLESKTPQNQRKQIEAIEKIEAIEQILQALKLGAFDVPHTVTINISGERPDQLVHRLCYRRPVK